MKLIVGLGNPGEKYSHNRHNVGFMVLDQLIYNSEFRIQNENIKFKFEKKFHGEIAQIGELTLLKPSTFMNKSGQSVSAVMRFYKIKSEDLYVVHDDLDIQLGEYKIQQAKGPQLHYGVESIEKEISTKDFWRARIGVENRKIRGNKGIPGEVYSLQNFAPEEKEIIEKTIKDVVDELVSVVS